MNGFWTKPEISSSCCNGGHVMAGADHGSPQDGQKCVGYCDCNTNGHVEDSACTLLDGGMQTRMMKHHMRSPRRYRGCYMTEFLTSASHASLASTVPVVQYFPRPSQSDLEHHSAHCTHLRHSIRKHLLACIFLVINMIPRILNPASDCSQAKVIFQWRKKIWVQNSLTSCATNLTDELTSEYLNLGIKVRFLSCKVNGYMHAAVSVQKRHAYCQPYWMKLVKIC